jgi:pilus assembly protein TadC
MGEHKQKAIDQAADLLIGHATDAGRVIEMGVAGFIKLVVPPTASPAQVRDMRIAFYAGADFLFSAIMGVLAPGAEPTAKDLERMNSIADELERFRKEVTTRHKAPEREQ